MQIIQTDLYYQIYASNLRAKLDISSIIFTLIFEAYQKNLTVKEFYYKYQYLPL
jgi:hypothetical protein